MAYSNLIQELWLQAYGNLNGDGFGIGWFSQHQECKPQDPSPCVFTSVTPAWYNLVS